MKTKFSGLRGLKPRSVFWRGKGSGTKPATASVQTRPAGLPYSLLSLGKCLFAKMSNAPRENRVFAGKRVDNGKYAMLTRQSRGNLSAENGFCLTSARDRESSCAGGSGARQPSGLPAFFLLFHRKDFPRFNQKNKRGKAHRNPAFRPEIFRNEV